MMQDSLTLYKLIILYMLQKVSFPMTTAQITDFILEQEYTTFLTLQQAISELMESGLMAGDTVANRTHLKITEEGRTTLEYFGNRLSNAIKNDVDTFLLENEFELRNEVSIMANYYKSVSTGEFEAHLVAKEKDIAIVDLKLSVPIEQMAATICENWKQKNELIYKYLTEQLF